MPDDQTRELLSRMKTVAVVGLSDNSARPSQRVVSSLQHWGYRILPVNPHIKEALGERAYPDLASLPERPDLVLVFRHPEAAAALAAEAARLNFPALWFQPGTFTDEAVALAQASHLTTIAGPCIAKECLRLMVG